MNSSAPAPSRFTLVAWLICFIAAVGFAFDTYELLIMPQAGPPALTQLLAEHGKPPEPANVARWVSYIMWGSAICGGVFGLLGGYLTDRFGRRRVLTWSIMLYAVSSAASGFSTSAAMLLAFRCLTFIGVCVEFVAAVAWLSELFPEPKRREAVLGFTQAFASFGGLLAAVAWTQCSKHADLFPTIMGGHDAWRYALISGLIPALPLIVIRPFLPESPLWQAKKLAGTLRRPSLRELFVPRFLRTTSVTALLFACGFAVAFGAIQLSPQIVPKLFSESKEFADFQAQLKQAKPDSPEFKAIKARMAPQPHVGEVSTYQEVGGLLGRFALAALALVVVRRGALLRMFQIPGLIIIPAVFFFAASGRLGADSYDVFRWGLAAAGFFTIAQFSFWGNYLPRVYPTYLRGTGESFAANIGGRMIGTAGNPLSTLVFAPLIGYFIPSLAASASLPKVDPMLPARLAYAAAITAFLAYAIGLIASFWLPEPPSEELPD